MSGVTSIPRTSITCTAIINKRQEWAVLSCQLQVNIAAGWFALQSQFLLRGAGSEDDIHDVEMLRRCSASPWPHLTWTQLCCQTWGVLAEGNEATQTLDIRVCHMFNLPEEGNYAVSLHRAWPLSCNWGGGRLLVWRPELGARKGHRIRRERQGSAI